MADSVKSPTRLWVKVEYACHGFRFTATAFDLDPREAGRRASSKEPQLAGSAPFSVSVNPPHEREIFNMAFRAYGDESAGDQIGLPPFGQGITVQARPTGAFHSASVKRQLLHGAPERTIVPSGKTNERNELIRIQDSLTRLTVFRWEPEMSHVETCLKPFFPYEPVGRAYVFGKRPFVQSRGH